MTDNPRLAIVIACYNYESYVDRAIQSVLKQAGEDCEVVVIDDGSLDDSWEVITRSGVRAYQIENSGARLACLYGFDRTTAPFVLFLDADDELKPGAIRTIIDRLDPGVAKLQFALTRIDADNNVISKALPPLDDFRDDGAIAQEVLRSGVYRSPPTSGNVFRRDVCELLREAAYDPFVDGVILFAAPLMGDIVSISQEIGYYRIHGRNDSGLGRMPEAGSLQRDLERYLLRMKHLQRIMRRLGRAEVLFDPLETFYYRERNFCLEIASGRRPPLRMLRGLIPKLLQEPISAKNKVGMAVFYCLASVLPNERSKALLAYRLKAGERTALGFAREIMGRRAAFRT